MSRKVNGLAKAIKIVGNQNRLAKELGVSRQAVNYWVTGDTNISPKHVLRICKLTGHRVKPHDLRPDIYPKGMYT